MYKHPKRRCVVITCFDEQQPGFLDFSYRIKSLAKVFNLYVLSKQPLTRSELLVDGVQYQVINEIGGKLGWAYYCLKCSLQIRRLNPEVVVLLHSAVSPIGWMVGTIPTCLYWNEHPTNLMQVTNQQPIFKRWLTLLMQKLLFRGATATSIVMPIGEDHAQDLIAHGVSPDRIKMIYMGVSDTFLSKMVNEPQPSATLKLIYMGTVSQERGREMMLQAMQQLSKLAVNVHLTIVGATAAEMDYCQSQIQTMGLQAYMAVHGRVSGDQIPHYLSQADAAICIWQPSPWNAFNPPTKLFEYLVSGLPVLANNIATHQRYIHNWKNGLLFEYGVEALVHAIQQLTHNLHLLPMLKLQAAESGQPYLWSKLEPAFVAQVHGLVEG